MSFITAPWRIFKCFTELATNTFRELEVTFIRAKRSYAAQCCSYHVHIRSFYGNKILKLFTSPNPTKGFWGDLDSKFWKIEIRGV